MCPYVPCDKKCTLKELENHWLTSCTEALFFCTACNTKVKSSERGDHTCDKRKLKLQEEEIAKLKKAIEDLENEKQREKQQKKMRRKITNSRQI
jgi:Zn-finger protein